MKLRNLHSIGYSIALMGLAACASTPEPEAVVQAPVQQAVVQEPVFQAPIAAPVQQPVTLAPPVSTFDPNAPLPGSAADFAYQAGGEPRIYFGYNRYDLNDEARNSLRRQAEWLNTYGNVTAIVEGNADERGTREYNLALGARRAESVKSFLISQGVAPSRLTTVSYGKERPIDGRSSEAGWSRNRNGHTNINSGAIG